MLALTGAIPALVVMWIFDRMDAKRPEPRSTLRKVTLAGAFSTIPVIVAGLLLGTMPLGSYEAAAWNGFIVAGLTEEIAKFLCVYLFVWKSLDFDERMDGITYGARAGLGFAMVENVLYLSQAADGSDFVIMWVGRALLAVPGHALWGGLVGYFAARRRFDRRGIGVIGGLAIAVFLHGLYDFAVFSAPALALDLGNLGAIVIAFGVPILIVVGGWVALRRLARRAVADDDRDRHRPGAPPPLIYRTE